jgi:hypothetical protein
MATTPKTQAETTEAEFEPAVELTVNDFCARLSETMTAPELIGAFAHVERVAGRVKDTEAVFRARFDLFVNQPV